MCLGIAGELTRLVADIDQLGMLEPETLVHVGFAMDKISKDKAAEALSAL
jgi:hydrogenase maturation factor